MTSAPVLLLHSSGLGSAQWIRLRGVSERVEAPDFSGYGRPWRGLPEFAWTDDLAIAEEALQRLGPAHVVGHSYGGFLALQLARRRPVLSVAAWEPVAFGLLGQRAVDEQEGFMDRSGGLEAWLRGFLSFWNGPGAWERMSARRRAPFLANGEKVYAEVLRCAQDRTTRGQWSEVGVPALLLAGAETKPEAIEVCGVIADAIEGAALELVPGAGHMGPVTHSSELEARLERWFAEVDG